MERHLKKRLAASLVKFDDDSVFAVPMTRTLVVTGGDVQISVSKNGTLAPPSGGTELKDIASVKSIAMGILYESDAAKGTEAGSFTAPGGTAATLRAVLTQPPGPLTQLDVSSPPGSEPAKVAIDNALNMLGIPWHSINQIPPSVIVASERGPTAAPLGRVHASIYR